MMKPDREQQRREQIMKSGGQLPGDPARAKAEDEEDFDAPDTGNFDTSSAGRAGGDPSRRQEVNESDVQLSGDRQRAADDERIDETGEC